MPTSLFQRVFALLTTLLGVCGLARGHNVPSMTVETRFAGGDVVELSANFDPRSFLATDPRSLPPVPASWYREQTKEQVAATQAKAKEYLQHSLGLLFDGKVAPMPELAVQAIDGADNSPLKADTVELHVLATCKVPIPEGATQFQVAYAKAATTELILLHGIGKEQERRPQVLFPGETSRPLVFRTAPPPAPPAPEPEPGTNMLLTAVLALAIAAVFTGWRLLEKHRHYHRAHRRPKDRR